MPIDSPARPYTVLFLCTANSARSIIAESLLRHWGGDRFRAFSAGSSPAGEVNPIAVDMLNRMQLPTSGLRSKSWDEFAGPQAHELDFVFTVCDRAAAEVCPTWPGQPMTAHWGIADPAAVVGDEVTRYNGFRTALRELENRIKLFIELPISALDSLALQRRLDAIGETATSESD